MGDGADDSSDFAAQPRGNVTVAHGVYRMDVPITEMSVAELRQRMADQLDIHPDSVAMLDGRHVGDDASVRAGQRLTFVGRELALPFDFETAIVDLIAVHHADVFRAGSELQT